MNLETKITNSEWWRQAQKMPDRHFDPAAGVSLADHLVAVHRNLRFLCSSEPMHDYFPRLRGAIVNAGLDLAEIEEILSPVALLHDIGKTQDDKDVKIRHPLTGKVVQKRHPVVGVSAALELLPIDLKHRHKVIALIEEHNTPHGCYMQFRRNGQIPKRKSWVRLDRKIDAQGDGTGLMLLTLINFADIHGHDNVEDVSWFLDEANTNYLQEKGKWLPVPDRDAIESLPCATS